MALDQNRAQLAAQLQQGGTTYTDPYAPQGGGDPSAAQQVMGGLLTIGAPAAAIYGGKRAIRGLRGLGGAGGAGGGAGPGAGATAAGTPPAPTPTPRPVSGGGVSSGYPGGSYVSPTQATSLPGQVVSPSGLPYGPGAQIAPPPTRLQRLTAPVGRVLPGGGAPSPGAGSAGAASSAARTAATTAGPAAASRFLGIGGGPAAAVAAGVAGGAANASALDRGKAGLVGDLLNIDAPGPLDTSGDSIKDQFVEGMQFGGPVAGAVNVGIGGLQNLGLFGGGGGDGDGGGDSEPKPPTGRERVSASFDAAAQSGLVDPAMKDQLLGYYSVLAQIGGSNKAAADEAAAQVQGIIAELAAGGIGSVGQQQGMGFGEPVTPEEVLAQQAYVANVIQPFTDAMRENQAARTGVLQNMVGSLPGEYQDPIAASLLSQGLANDSLINAYGAQAAMAPQTAAWEAMNQQRQGIADQLLSQGVNAALYPPQPQQSGGGGGLTLDDLLAQG